MLGARFAGSGFVDAGLAGLFPGRSPGKVLSRLKPSAESGFSVDDAAGGGGGGACWAHAVQLNPNSKHK